MNLENQEKIDLLEEKYNNNKIRRYELEEEILAIEKDLIDTDNTSRFYKEEKLEQIGILRRKEGVLTSHIENDKKGIIELEKNAFDLESNLNKERSQLQDYKKDIEYKKLENTTTQLKLLWRHEPSWIERQHIEQATSLKKTNLPFTLTQGFIAFEKYIDIEVRKLDTDGKLLRDTSFNLYAKIDYIAKNDNLLNYDKKTYHDIRRARNKWFHSAIYPEVEIMSALIELLNNKNVNIIL
ncbi:MAG TPA: hypothetical protein EYG98_04655 [Sulfurovum sp.]|nr:hypothetical protein [Sulfurovum sp.]